MTGKWLRIFRDPVAGSKSLDKWPVLGNSTPNFNSRYLEYLNILLLACWWLMSNYRWIINKQETRIQKQNSRYWDIQDTKFEIWSWLVEYGPFVQTFWPSYGVPKDAQSLSGHLGLVNSLPISIWDRKKYRTWFSWFFHEVSTIPVDCQKRDHGICQAYAWHMPSTS